MNAKEYDKLVKKNSPKEDTRKNALVAFLVGGGLAAACEIIVQIFTKCYSFEREEVCLWVMIGLIFVASLATALNFFDNWVEKCKMGIILPTSGFAHSITSSALDYKKEGVIALGSNFFKLAGSVILYGITSSFFLAILKVIING